MAGEIGPVLGDAVHNAGKARGVRIRNEDLAEILAGHHANQVGDALEVQFVKDIVQQQHGCKPVRAFHDFILRKLERHQERFLLPLRAGTADGMAVHGEQKIVALNAGGGIA